MAYLDIGRVCLHLDAFLTVHLKHTNTAAVHTKTPKRKNQTHTPLTGGERTTRQQQTPSAHAGTPNAAHRHRPDRADSHPRHGRHRRHPLEPITTRHPSALTLLPSHPLATPRNPRNPSSPLAPLATPRNPSRPLVTTLPLRPCGPSRSFEHVVAIGPRDAESRAQASSAASVAGRERSASVGPTTLGPKHSATQ